MEKLKEQASRYNTAYGAGVLTLEQLSSTLANLDNAEESAFAGINRYDGDFSYCLGLAVTVKKLMHPVFCASNYR